MASRDPASNQLLDFQKANPAPEPLTTESGAFVGNKSASASVGPRGPTVLQDHVYLDEQAHFDRERIPERVVHAKGAARADPLPLRRKIPVSRLKIFTSKA